MNLSTLFSQAEKRHCNTLTPDQKRDVHGRLIFAEIDPENIQDREVSIVVDTILRVASLTPTPTMERSAALAGSCPRCGASVSPVKLAIGSAAAYCQACRIALPETE